MKKLLTILLAASLFSCNSNTNETYRKPEDAQDAAREFIRASLDGKYDKARYYMLLDSAHQNQYLLERWKKNYDQLTDEEKRQFRESSIVVLNLNQENDSTASFTYFNSFKKDTTTFKVLRVSGLWQVDLKQITNHSK